MNATEVAPAPAAAVAVRSAYNPAIAYLKASVVALVVAHHAVLAYHPAASPLPVSLLAEPRSWQGWPIFDSHRAAWAGAFATVNDMFFMALMFFASGLFVWGSLRRKGGGAYLRDRAVRLGVPFVAVAAVVAPLSYYPSYLQIPGHGGFGDFLRDWAALGRWSAGPVWFTWVLLVFDAIAVGLAARAPGWGDALGRLTGRLARRPELYFVALVGVTAAVYVPVTLAVGPYSWVAVGPFNLQTSRLLLYLVYFFAGIGVGAGGAETRLLAREGALARRWPLWLAIAVAAFPAHILSAGVLRPVFFAVFCAAASFTCLALFLRTVQARRPVGESLSRNSYGIFLIHFAFVSWLGYALAGQETPALLKFALVTAGALALSWIGTILLRRIPAVARVI